MKCFFLCFLFIAADFSYAGLMFYPTRISFEGRDRSSTLTLINNGLEEETYRIGFVEKNMNHIGHLIEREDESQYSAHTMLRYSPRQVTVPAGGSQVVRVLLRKPSDLSSGEYRSHLKLSQIPINRGLGESRSKKEELSFKITPVFSYTLPVIVRHGDLKSVAKISNLQFNSDGNINLRVQREGNASLYGDLQVSFIPSDGSSPLVIAEKKGVAVYVPNLYRDFEFPVSGYDAGVDGKLAVTFSEVFLAKTPGKKRKVGKVLALAEFPLKEGY